MRSNSGVGPYCTNKLEDCPRYFVRFIVQTQRKITPKLVVCTIYRTNEKADCPEPGCLYDLSYKRKGRLPQTWYFVRFIVQNAYYVLQEVKLCMKNHTKCICPMKGWLTVPVNGIYRQYPPITYLLYPTVSTPTCRRPLPTVPIGTEFNPPKGGAHKRWWTRRASFWHRSALYAGR